MHPIRACAALALLLWAATGWAQEGNSVIRIEGSSGGYYECRAYTCMSNTESQKSSTLNNLRQVMEIDCNPRGSTYQRERCARSRDAYFGAEQCFRSVCSQATCRQRNLTTGQCLSPAYFR